MIKYVYFWILSFIQNNSQSKIFWLVNSVREKNYLQFYLYRSNLEIFIIENLNEVKKKKLKIYKKSNSLKLFYFSNITKKKNLLNTIEIVKKTHNKKIILDIYGKIIDDNYFLKIKKAIKYNSNINYRGYIDDHQKRNEVFSNYHYLIHHSLGENYGHILVESMSCGVPFITNQSHPWIDIDTNFLGYIMPRELIYQQVEFLKKLFKLENKTYQVERKKFLLYFKNKILLKEDTIIKNYSIFFKKIDKYKFAKK